MIHSLTSRSKSVLLISLMFVLWALGFILPPYVSDIFSSNLLDTDGDLLVPLMVTIILIGVALTAGMMKVKIGKKGWVIAPGFQKRMSTLINGRLLVFHGHHPVCDLYSKHEIKWKEKSICSGCYGTALGLLVALALTTFYYLFVIRSSLFAPLETITLLTAGFLLLSWSQMRYIIPSFTGRRMDPRVALFAHASLPLAAITPLMYSLSLKSNLSLITALLIGFSLIGVRLLSSGTDHGKTCSECDEFEDCVYRETN